ncbi:uncharacterized protein AC631_04604 [Debaryomyces fabryi]|uniref:Uncharacterized protein n=1 Tax=Debaryomyces fabryi TaxID=58627 RepID=A0A0V1PTY6_9ASCO|nr:uncharacterized protein AC631_04604 [Debaryomyces fabryi]KRZ99634.1 hypothetical protein AC631_04604 [Debaryomyces fabryi]CUM46448.1 unnamed protein product [Debaryomyces fabryi]
MNHANHSQSSLNDNNYYDISIGKNVSGNSMNGNKSFPSVYPPRRVGSLSSLLTLNESKRPGDYYIQKMSNSSINLTGANSKSKHALNVANRPKSGESILSLQSNYSDETSLANSSQFDVPDSRLSSLTSNSLISPSQSPSHNLFCANNNSSANTSGSTDSNDKTNDKINEENENEDESNDQINSSLSTLTLKNKSIDSSSDLSYNQSPSTSQVSRPRLKASSTTNVIKQRPPKLQTIKSATSLQRTKTKFLSAKETKERQQLRKKLYDENDDDDDILANDLDIFNVPVIKNHAELYINKNSSKYLSRHDLVTDDSKYNVNTSTEMKPCPLPGRLNSTSDITRSSNIRSDISDDSILEESEHSFSFSTDNDGEISQNISNFYNQRSESFSKLMKMTREQDMIYKLPNFIKSQSSIEDINLISPEKINCLDQTRPINLPPKNNTDKSKHNKEFKRVLNNYENNTKLANETRKRISESIVNQQQQWFKLMMSSKKEFNKKLTSDKAMVRKLSWESNCPDKFRYDFFMNALSNDDDQTITNLKDSFQASQEKYSNLSHSIKVNKDIEFNNVIELILQRPLYDSIMKELHENIEVNFNLDDFKNNLRHLLYIKSLSENGLRKQDEIFLIPFFLILFQNGNTMQEIYVLIELVNHNVLDDEFLKELNKSLGAWTNVNNFSSSSMLYKFLYKFNNPKEFENLNSIRFFEILIQINDKLPLSLSAPSTPIVSQSGQFSFTSPKTNGSESNNSSKTNSIDQMNDLNIQNALNSSSYNLILKFLQLIIVYAHSKKTKSKNNLKVFQSFLMIIFQYYHINWNNFSELVKLNRSIKLNNSADQSANLDSFADKWKDVFKRF